MSQYDLYFDAGKKDRDIYLGFIIKENGKTTHKFSHKLEGIIVDNNVAEYYALITGLIYADLCNIQDLRVFGDSQNIIKSLQKHKCPKSKIMKGCYYYATGLIKRFEKIEFYWIPDKENIEAHREAR